MTPDRRRGHGARHAAMTALACLVIAMMLAIAIQVGAAALGVNPLVGFGRALPLVDDAVTQNGLRDLQWHILVVVGLLPAGLVWLANGHVRVDFLYGRLSSGARRAVDIGGAALFALPFLVMAIPASWQFAARAWRADEGSRDGGLVDLWLIKAALPAGLALLAAAVALDALRRLRFRDPDRAA